MELDWREHIICDPRILCGKPTLKGTRLSVEFVLDLLAGGFTRQEIDDNYPNLSEERVRAALAFAADAVRQSGRSAYIPGSPDSQATQVELRLAEGTQVNGIPKLRYMLQLMACLEALNSAIRWGVYVERDPVGGMVRNLDKIMVVFVATGWCHEAFELLRHREAKGAIDRSMLAGRNDLLVLWDRIVADPPDPLVLRVKDIRNKYFGHFDATVMGRFIDWQAQHGVPDPFFLSDEIGQVSRCRFLWPAAACILDLHLGSPDATSSDRMAEVVDSLFDSLKETVDLLVVLIEAWTVRNGLGTSSAWRIVELNRE